MLKSNLVSSVASLRSYGRPDQPYRHQAIVLLWALGRARQGAPRLVRWSSVRKTLAELLSTYGLAESKPTAEYPFVALADTIFWEVVSGDVEVPRAHGSAVLGWLNSTDPLAGLRPDVYEQMQKHGADRGAVVGELLNRYFRGERAADLLRAVGLLHATARHDGEWDLAVGDVARRQTIHELFGGARNPRLGPGPVGPDHE